MSCCCCCEATQAELTFRRNHPFLPFETERRMIRLGDSGLVLPYKDEPMLAYLERLYALVKLK